KKLIVSNPEQALQQTLPFALRQKLPAEFAPYLEKRVSGRGVYNVMYATPPPGSGDVHLLRTVTVGDQTYQAFVYGKRFGRDRKENVAMHGVAIGEYMALDESP